MKKNRLISKINVSHQYFAFTDLKLSVDYNEDLNFVRRIWSNLEKISKRNSIPILKSLWH